ncbi:MAG: potassium transporter Kup [Hyphomicrobiaceae bacterium]|nr:potassium transporter Kup [Hyphomicrobiaceae bacterium]
MTTSGTPAPGDASVPSAPEAHGHHGSIWVMALGSVGVVYGDIGTSPLYAFRESMHHLGHAPAREEVLGVVSLLIWSLTFIVTLKYVLFLMRADNKGEGGTLSLLALAQQALGGRTNFIFIMGIAGAALFYGDSIITPAISVLSAVEGLKLVTPVFDPYIVPITMAILIGLFSVQSRGTGAVARWFGPITALWFVLMAIGGVMHIGDDLGIFWAFNPWYAVHFLFSHGLLGFIVLGSVFLAVTGAEALYADMGHFGRLPIQLAWMGLIFPALTLTYLGQGALILSHPEAIENPFFLLFPEWALIPMVIMATVATVIASQAVITGAYSLTQQAVQLGLLPRFDFRHTSEQSQGQIYMPRVTRLILVGVLLLVMVFQSSSRLANAYGIAVTGALVVDSLLTFVVVWKAWRWSLWLAAAIITPFLILEGAFLSANLLKLLEGGYMPVLIAGTIMVVMWTWARGTRILFEKSRRDSIALTDFVRIMERAKPFRAKGTAIFLTSDPDSAPAALMHNLKHNNVLHDKNVILTVKTANSPRISDAERIKLVPVNDDFVKLTLTFGYMEVPNVPQALGQCRKVGLKFEIMSTSFFLGRRTLKIANRSEMPRWQEKLFIALARDAGDATDFYEIPSGRVVEMGQQVTV